MREIKSCTLASISSEESQNGRAALLGRSQTPEKG